MNKRDDLMQDEQMAINTDDQFDFHANEDLSSTDDGSYFSENDILNHSLL